MHIIILPKLRFICYRFASCEQFWEIYSHIVRPGDLQSHSDFHIFKEGIKPMWEVIYLFT